MASWRWGWWVLGLCVCVKEFGAVVVSGVVSHWEPPETVHHLSMRVAGQKMGSMF